MSESVTGVGFQDISGVSSVSTRKWFRLRTITSTEKVTQTGKLTSSVVGANLLQTGIIFFSIPGATAATTETSSGSTTSSLVSSDPSESSRNWSHRTPLGPIIGGAVAVLALILLSIFLVILFMKHRALKREIRLRAEVDQQTPTPLNFVNTREGLNRHISVNDDGSRSELPSPTVYSSQIISPANGDLKRARTNYTVHSSIHDRRFYLASAPSVYSSDANHHTGNHFQSNSSQDLITHGTITEEMPNTPTYISGQSPIQTHFHHETDSTNISTNSDYAPPAYDSLPRRTRTTSYVNSSFSQNIEPSTPV